VAKTGLQIHQCESDLSLFCQGRTTTMWPYVIKFPVTVRIQKRILSVIICNDTNNSGNHAEQRKTTTQYITDSRGLDLHPRNNKKVSEALTAPCAVVPSTCLHGALVPRMPCGSPKKSHMHTQPTSLCSLGLSATSKQYFSLTTNRPQQSVLFSQNNPTPDIIHQRTEQVTAHYKLQHRPCLDTPAGSELELVWACLIWAKNRRPGPWRAGEFV
jgi:hypothetical protein